MYERGGGDMHTLPTPLFFGVEPLCTGGGKGKILRRNHSEEEEDKKEKGETAQ